MDKWVKGAKRKTGGAHLMEEGRLKPDQGSQCLTQVRGVACKFRTLSKNLAEEGKWDKESVQGEAAGGDRIKEWFCSLSKMGETLSWMIC